MQMIVHFNFSTHPPSKSSSNIFYMGNLYDTFLLSLIFKFEFQILNLFFFIINFYFFSVPYGLIVFSFLMHVRVFIMYSQYNWNITLFGSCELDCTCIARLETRSMYYGYQLLVGFNLALYVIHLL